MLLKGSYYGGIRFGGTYDEVMKKLTVDADIETLTKAAEWLKAGDFDIESVQYWSHDSYDNEFRVVAVNKKDSSWKLYLKFDATTVGLREKLEYIWYVYEGDDSRKDVLNKIWRTAKAV